MGNALKSIAAKITGADVAADQMARAADAQANASRAAAQLASKNTQEAAAQSARQQEQGAARAAAQGAAADAQAKPLQEADVQLAAGPVGGSVSANARKRRQTFGIGSAGSGVNI